MRVTLPLRVTTSITAGVVASKAGKQVIRRHGRRRVVRHQVTELSHRRRPTSGGDVTFTGSLLDRKAKPIAVCARASPSARSVPEGTEELVATLTTGAEGGFSLTRRRRSRRAACASSTPAPRRPCRPKTP